MVQAPFPGRIAIVTNTFEQNSEEFLSAQALVLRYGSDRVIHRTWPVMFAAEPQLMIRTLEELASDPEVGAIIINQAVVNTNMAIDAARAIRGDDIFIVVASPAEDPRDVSARVDLALDTNFPAIGQAFVAQAIEMGAEAIVHISFPRHMAVPMLATRRDNMAEAARRVGIPFHEVNSIDPLGEGGMAAAQLYIAENVGRWVEQFGVNTAFFSTNCGQQIPLLQQILEYGAIYVQPCCPSPFHAFPSAFGIGIGPELPEEQFSHSEMVEATRQVIHAAGMQGRLSNWALPGSWTWTNVGFRYAIEWLNGNVSQEIGVVEMNVIHRLIGDYAYELYGERMYMELDNLRVGNDVFPLYVVGISPFIVY